uniref:Uncharacterized protein n=1 Tax=Glossina pallidipes TaxID=7398 RepID=A0A1B0ABU0_GLOPL
MKRRETEEEIKRDGKSTNRSCKAEKRANGSSAETATEVQLTHILKEAVNTWILKKKKSQQICDSVDRAFQQLCSLENSINNEIQKLKQQRRVLRMGITSGLRLTERKNTSVQQNADSSAKSTKAKSTRTLDGIIVEKFSNKHKFACSSPRCRGEEFMTSTPCLPTACSPINSSKPIETDRGALGDHKSLNKLTGKRYKGPKRSYELAEKTSTDLKRDSREKRLSNIKNFLTSPENMDLKGKNDQIINICYHAACGNGFYNNSVSTPNNYRSEYYNALSGYDNNGVFNRSCYRQENCVSSDGYGYNCTHNESYRKYPLRSAQRDATTNTCVRYTPRVNTCRTCRIRCPPSCARRRTDLDTENFCYRTGSSPCRPRSSSASSKRVSNSSKKKEDNLCTKYENAIKSKLQKDLREHFQEARGRARAKVREKPQTKDISEANCEEYVFFKKKKWGDYCKNQERECDKIEDKCSDESAETSCSDLSELLDRCADEGIRWRKGTKTDCINEKSAKREEPTSSSPCTKVRSQSRICEFTFTKRKPRTCSVSPIQTCSPCCWCSEHFMDETQCCNIPLTCDKRPKSEYSFETLCMLKKMKITEYKPSKPKNNGKDKQYNDYVNKYQKEQEKESLKEQPSSSPKRSTPGYQSPMKSAPESKRTSTRRSRNGESPIHTPAPTPSSIPTPSPIPTPPIRTPAPTPPSVPTPPIQNFVAPETSYHSINSVGKDIETKVDQVPERTTTVDDLNTTKIKSKECISIKECIAEDGTQITQIERHLSVEEIFNSNIDQDNVESNNNNETRNTSPSVQDLLVCLKNFLAAFQKQWADVQGLQRLGATVVEALSRIDICNGGDKVKIMKTIETQCVESEIYDVPDCTSIIPYAISTEVTMRSRQNIEDFPQCSRRDIENREVNLQTLSPHDEKKLVDCGCQQECSDDIMYDKWRAVDQRKKQLPRSHFPRPPPVTCSTSLAYYESTPKTSPASQRHTIDCSTYSRRSRSKVTDTSASLSPEDRNMMMSLDIGNHGNAGMFSNSNYKRLQPPKYLICRRSDCPCTQSQVSSGLQSTSLSKYSDSFGPLYAGSSSSCAFEEPHVKCDSKSSNSIYKDCTRNIRSHTLQQRPAFPARNNCSVIDRQIPITTCSIPQFSNLDSHDFLNMACARKHPSTSQCVTNIQSPSRLPNLLQCQCSASRHGDPCSHSASKKTSSEAAPLRGILKCPTPADCKSRAISYEDCLSRNSDYFEAEQCTTVTNEGPSNKVQVGISYKDAGVRDRQNILEQADRNAESILYKDQNGRPTKRVFRTTKSESAVRKPLNFCQDVNFHASNSTCRLDDQVPPFTHCPCMYGAYKSMLDIYYKGKGKPLNNNRQC